MSATIIIAVAVFALGVVAGIVFIVSTGIRREEWDSRRTGPVSIIRLAPDRLSQGTRALVGLFVRQRADVKPAAAESVHRQHEDPIRQLTVVAAALADGRR